MKTIELPPQGFRDFDLPVAHLLEAERHYIPLRSHDRGEIARRRDLTSGTLQLEQQLLGTRVAETILSEISDEEGLQFAADTLALSALNTAWYSYAQARHDVMRRRLKLPDMAHPRSLNAELYVADTNELLKKATSHASTVVHGHEYGLRGQDARQRTYGRTIGNIGLRLAIMRHVRNDSLADVGDDVERQTVVRSVCIATLERAREAHRTIGAHPSLAQLADPYSHLSVWWHRHAPGSAQTAVSDALAAGSSMVRLG